ncbi:MAG: UDP-N-acetylmuramyl-tripeptide synthetase, partial [Candidatus Saccharibacteria bacterium]|nr:UDP-N-acetylmuramyl-tripeptide synthetase [Candidatus Saccharibacteria bacterium]
MSFRDIPGYNSLIIPYHILQAIFFGLKYHHPGKKLRVIGVTGTNGKTTTAFMIWKMLNKAGLKTGLMTTVAWGCPGFAGDWGGEKKKDAGKDGLIKQIEHMTTVDSKTLNQRMSEILESGAEYLVLEVTSHALAQYRTFGVPIEIAVMTNISHEHLDYHKTMERYVAAKCKLFKKADFGIINYDDDHFQDFASTLEEPETEEVEDPDSGIWSAEIHTKKMPATGKKYITYGIKNPATIRAEAIQLEPTGVKYSCNDINLVEGKVLNTDNLTIETRIPGEFNVYNSLAAVAVGEKLNLTERQIERGIKSLKSVEGRMNAIKIFPEQNFDVIIDFAHTPDAFQKVFDSVKAKSGRIIALTGGAGRRDESTRETRGEIMGKYADIAIITEDDSRDEDPAEIAKMFVAGCKNSGLKEGKVLKSEKTSGKYKKHEKEILVELNRRKAINLAIN